MPAELVPFPGKRPVPQRVADRAQSLANKLQRLVLEYPMEAAEVEKLIDKLLAKHAPKG